MPRDRAGLPRAAAILFLVAGTTLLYEVLLTRICSLRYQFHMSFVVVGNGLLAMGASGTFIARYQAAQPSRAARNTAWACLGLLLSLLLAWGATVALPVIRAPLWGLGLLDLTLFNLATAPPFFFAGAAIGLILTARSRAVHPLYAADLAGAATGALVCPLLLGQVGAAGSFGLLLVMALAALGLAIPGRALRPRLMALVGALVMGAATPHLSTLTPMPGKDPRTPVASWWTSQSRVDLLPVAPDARRIYGLGRRATQPIPPQYEIVQDGTASTYVTDFSGHPEALPLLGRSLYSAGLQLLERPSVYVIGAGGGHDLWAAARAGAPTITAIELNRPIIALHHQRLASFSADLLQRTGLRWVAAEGRSALMREEGHFDLVQMSGIDTWAALASGAYMLAENYLYTTEAMRDMLRRLTPHGILQVTRMAAEMETLRLLVLQIAALRRVAPQADPARCVAVIGAPDHLVTTLVRPAGLSTEDQRRLVAWAARSGLDLLYLPDSPRADSLHALLRQADRRAFIRAFPRDISPTTDDRPYFFHFTRWRPFAAVDSLREPTYISQGNPLFIVGHLLFACILAWALLLLPLRGAGVPPPPPPGTALYFGGIGLGFIAVEMGLIQKLTLLLGHPAWSLSVTLAGLLSFSGLGSLLAARLRPGLARLALPVALALVLILLLLLLPPLVQATLGWPLPARVALSLGLMAPAGLLMGMPFALGIRALSRRDPGQVPLAWAINGFATVIGAILATMLSVNLGFSAVFLAAAACYGLAFLAGGRLTRPGSPAFRPSEARIPNESQAPIRAAFHPSAREPV